MMRWLVLLMAWMSVEAGAQELKDLYPPRYTPESDSATATKVAPRVRAYDVYINGLRSQVFETEQGAIVVPYKGVQDPDKIRERASCIDSYEAPMIEAKVPVVGDYSVFAGVVATTIVDLCKHVETKGSYTTPNLDIGVSKKDKGRTPGETKIFNRNLGPNMFFERDF